MVAHARFSDDQKLRSVGCKIHSRPRNRPAVWELPNGDLMEADDALIRMAVEIMALAEEVKKKKAKE